MIDEAFIYKHPINALGACEWIGKTWTKSYGVDNGGVYCVSTEAGDKFGSNKCYEGIGFYFHDVGDRTSGNAYVAA